MEGASHDGPHFGLQPTDGEKLAVLTAELERERALVRDLEAQLVAVAADPALVDERQRFRFAASLGVFMGFTGFILILFLLFGSR